MAAATQRRFGDQPLPAAVVLDSDFAISVVNENEEFHQICVPFANRLRDAGVRIVFTPLLRVDFWNGWRRAVARRGLPPELIADIETRGEQSEGEIIMRFGDQLLSDFLVGFEALRVELSSGLLDQALDHIARYNLRPHDGCLAATAFHSGVHAVVSLDSDFIRVDGLELWNDHVPERRTQRRRSGLR